MRTSTMVKIETAFDGIPSFLKDATRNKLVIRVADWSEAAVDLTVTIDDVLCYYAYDARNITSGCRSIGKFTSDWRHVDGIAKVCLDIFKAINIEGLRRECKRNYSHIMSPKF